MKLRAFFAIIPLLALLKVTACSDQTDPAAPENPPNDPPPPGSSGTSGTSGEPNNPDAAPIPKLVTKQLCKIASTGDDGKVIRGGTILLPEAQLDPGELFIDKTGVIVCANANCAASPGYAEATKIECKDVVISPGLINPHDHISFANNPPHKPQTERYEHRNDWRKGARGHAAIKNTGKSNPNAVETAELRFVMTGVTAIAGAGGAAGLARNVDGSPAQLEAGLKMTMADSDTFPLKDSGDNPTFPTTCSAFSATRRTADSIKALQGYLPHISEGIDDSAHAEFVCQSDGLAAAPDPAHDLIKRQTAVVHGMAVNPDDVARYRSDSSILIWSPRSNIDLYGNTAPIGLYDNLGVPIALGTDWLPSGSMNMSRELRCADELNQKYFNKKLTDKQLWQMVTINAAFAIGAQHAIGQIKPGYLGDIAIFDATGKSSPYRAIIEAGVEDTVLVLRGGKALYGDSDLVEKPGSGGGPDCEALTVCNVTKAACVKRDLQGKKTLANLQSSADVIYPLFYCKGEIPKDEPTCVPARGPTANKPLVSVYSAISGTDKDGDGVPDATDNCPTVFNPIRPMDADKQPDFDGDGIGDACDKCPLVTGEACTPPVSGDMDGDGVPNGTDNCPEDANADQIDADKDGKGAVCDKDGAGANCDDRANPGSAGCPTIYTIAQIRNPAAPGHPTPASTRAIVKNVWVTAVKTAGAGGFGFFIQEGTATFSGMYVGTAAAPTVVVGNKIDIEGDYIETGPPAYDVSTLINPTITVVDPGTTLPFGPVTIDPAVYQLPANKGIAGEPWEGMLCEVPGPITVTVANSDAPADYDEFGIGVPKLRVDDQLWDAMDNNYAVDTTSFLKVVGICGWSFNNRKMWPRSAADLPQ